MEAFAVFCQEWCIKLNLTAPYHLASWGSTERGDCILKELFKKTDSEGTCFDTAFAAYKDSRNARGYSPAQLFFLRNVRDPRLPDLGPEPEVEDMLASRDRVRTARAVGGEDKPVLPPLETGDLVLGQHPKTCE